jgi:beta-mannosidase
MDFGNTVEEMKAMVAHKRTLLSAVEWELARQPRRGTEPDWGDTVPASVPGCVLDDLARAGLVPDPFYGENFRACAWTGEWTFWYRTTFTLREIGVSERDFERAALQFDGIDTYAEVFLNGQSLGAVSNQFRRHRFGVSDALDRTGPNVLVVRIDPVKAAFREWFEREKPDETGVVSLFDNDRPWIRKAQMTFGWDNCPYLVAGGITLPVWLEIHSGAEMRDLHWHVPEVVPAAGKARLQIGGSVQGLTAPGVIQLDGACEDSRFSTELPVAEDGPWEATVEIDDARFWWPNGLGEPDLYDVTVSLSCQGTVSDEEHLRVGLRTIEVVTEPVETRTVDYRLGQPNKTSKPVMDGGLVGPWGRLELDEPTDVEVRPFRFKVNGRPVFIKGLDWQAPDVLVGRITDDKIRSIVAAARDMNCNMLRAWGGGTVERESFYDACDEVGLLLWQDFFFACAVYPRDQRFLDEIRLEAEDLVKRLRNHTCLAVWCGDNESDMFEHDMGRDPSLNPINKTILPGAVTQFDPQKRHYHPSSPGGGPYPRSDFGGDKRNWGPNFPQNNYFHIRQEEARFISESGTKALPSVETIERFLPPERRWPMDNLTWKLHAGDHDHLVRGDYLKEAPRVAFFKTPGNLEEAVEVSQFARAWGLKLLIEQCRRRKDECGGILVWKTSDQWPSYDHGLFDYYGHQRLDAEWIKEAYRPLAVSMTQDWRKQAAALEVWLSNDSSSSVTGMLKLERLVVTETGEATEVCLIHESAQTIEADTSRLVASFPVDACDLEQTLFRLRFAGEGMPAPCHSTYTSCPAVAYRYHST